MPTKKLGICVLSVAMTLVGLPLAGDAQAERSPALVEADTVLMASLPLRGAPEPMSFGIEVRHGSNGEIGAMSFVFTRSNRDLRQLTFLRPRDSSSARFSCGSRLGRCQLSDAGGLSDRVALDLTFEAAGPRRVAVQRCANGRPFARTVTRRGHLTGVLRVDTQTDEFGVVTNARNSPDAGATIAAEIPATISRSWFSRRSCELGPEPPDACRSEVYIGYYPDGEFFLRWDGQTNRTEVSGFHKDLDGPFDLLHAVSGHVARRLVRDTSPPGQLLSEARIRLDPNPYLGGSVTYTATGPLIQSEDGPCRAIFRGGEIDGTLSFETVAWSDMKFEDVSISARVDQPLG